MSVYEVLNRALATALAEKTISATEARIASLWLDVSEATEEQ